MLSLVITPDVENALASAPYRLTWREIQVARLVYEENTAYQIGARLEISPRTVEVHRARIMNKLKAKSTVGMVKLLASMVVASVQE